MKPTACLAVVIALASCQLQTSRPKLPPREAFFMEHVKPVLERNCLRCHSGLKPSAGFNLTSRGSALTARLHGQAFIAPGKPDDSLLIIAISRNGNHPKLMPRLTISLTDMQIGALREWIEDGAAWPAGPEGKLAAVHNPENP
jgi:cytochrome c